MYHLFNPIRNRAYKIIFLYFFRLGRVYPFFVNWYCQNFSEGVQKMHIEGVQRMHLMQNLHAYAL